MVNINPKSEKLGSENILKLLVNLSFPAVIAMIVSAFYNVVDTYFVGRGVGDLAVGALAVSFPIQMIILGIGQMVGIGAASSISRRLGAKDVEAADKVAGNAFFSIIILGFAIAILGTSFVDVILKIFSTPEPLFQYAKEYTVIIFSGSVFFSFAVASNNLVRAEGNAFVSMMTMVIGAVINIILDPIMIINMGLGVKGAAYATIISQFISFVFVLGYIYSGKSTLKVKFHHLSPNWEFLKEIFGVGFSAFSRMIAGSLVAIIINHSLNQFGDEYAFTVFGVANRLIMFMFMPLFGIVQGMQPIIGFNYGAKNYERIKKTLKLSIIFITVISAMGWLVGEVFGRVFMDFFIEKNDVVDWGTKAFRVIILAVPIVGIQIAGATLFQSLGKAIPSLILSLLRQVLIFIPTVLILPRLWNLGLWGVWIAFPVSDIISTLITVLMMKNVIKKIKNELTPS